MEKKKHCRELSICKTLTDKNSYLPFVQNPPTLLCVQAKLKHCIQD